MVAACDVPGIQKLLPESFRKIKEVRFVAWLAFWAFACHWPLFVWWDRWEGVCMCVSASQ